MPQRKRTRDDLPIPRHSVPPHPIGVNPMGNALMKEVTDRVDREKSLGQLRVLADGQLLNIVEMLDPTSLIALSQCSRALYCFASDPEIWKRHVLNRFEGNFHLLHGSWKQTYLSMSSSSVGKDEDLSSHTHIRVPLPLRVPFYSDALYASWAAAHAPLPSSWLKPARHNALPSLSARGLTLSHFKEDFEVRGAPLIIRDATTAWKAHRHWRREQWQEDFGHMQFACSGYDMTLSNFYHYLDSDVGDIAPLYLFDTRLPTLLKADYETPPYFQDNLWDISEGKEPPLLDSAWVIVGGTRSFSGWHKDPNASHAWNACIQGQKKWLFFPPGHPPPGVMPSRDGSNVTSPISLIEWFHAFYEEAVASGLAQGGVQQPGDIVFVPRGWWHAVLNMTPTLCITQNYVAPSNLPHFLRFVRDRPESVSGLKEGMQADEMLQVFEEYWGRKSSDGKAMLEDAWNRIGGRDGKAVAEAAAVLPAIFQEGRQSFQFSFGAGSG
jgi:hypothetical protein